jgi:hypothetical protein
MNKDLINLQEAYSRIYLKENDDLRDQIEPSFGERIEKTYGEEIPPIEGEDEDGELKEDAQSGSYTLYYKDPEAKKTSVWYTADSLEDLVDQVNKGNQGMDYDSPVVDEDRVFKNKEELLDYCSHSDFFIKGPDGNLVSGYTVKPGDWENDELHEKKKQKFSVSTPTQGQLVSKMRAPIHKPTKEIKPKKGVYNRQQFKKYD